MNIFDYGFNCDMLSEDNIGIPARIISVHKGRFGIVSEFGEEYAGLKGTEYYFEGETIPTVGDFVLIDHNDDGDSRIIKTLKRKTCFSRRDPDKSRGEQVVAANFDYVFIMQSMNHDFNSKRLERYLTAAYQSKAEPVIILTKADLIDDYLPYILKTSRVAPGVKTCIVSSETGYGMNELSPYLQKGKTIVFLGSSGVGKSSLVNYLVGRKIMDVNGIREDDSKGRHTTTHRELIMLKNGTIIIDTPGMRELGMWDVSDGLNDTFSDIESLADRCRFRNCIHDTEPGCAVREAIESGELDEARFENYLKLRNEARYSEDSVNYLRLKEEFFKNIAIGERKRKKIEKKRGIKRK